MTTNKTAAAAKAAPADINPATDFNPSGAPVQTVPDVDPSHPSVDADPRANTSADQNRIDFNDRSRTDADVVAEQLGIASKGAE